MEYCFIFCFLSFFIFVRLLPQRAKINAIRSRFHCICSWFFPLIFFLFHFSETWFLFKWTINPSYFKEFFHSIEVRGSRTWQTGLCRKYCTIVTIPSSRLQMWRMSSFHCFQLADVRWFAHPLFIRHTVSRSFYFWLRAIIDFIHSVFLSSSISHCGTFCSEKVRTMALSRLSLRVFLVSNRLKINAQLKLHALSIIAVWLTDAVHLHWFGHRR